MNRKIILTIGLFLCIVTSIIGLSLTKKEVNTYVAVNDNMCDDEYLCKVITWAEKDGISDTNNLYDPITRGETMQIFYNYAGRPTVYENMGDFKKYNDVPNTSPYYNAIKWAQVNNITNGTTKNTFNEKDYLTHAQLVTFLYRYRFGKNGVKLTEKTSFLDIDPNSVFYDAINWATVGGIATGYSENTFEPYTQVDKARVLTYLYRLENIVYSVPEEMKHIEHNANSIVISKNYQKLIYYKNNNIVLVSNVITGSDEHPTPIGRFKVVDMQKDIVLTTYQSHVNYWMAFKGSLYGMHDAVEWRQDREFFEQQYNRKYASHGCVNMPLRKAKQLYQMVNTDTEVIITE